MKKFLFTFSIVSLFLFLTVLKVFSVESGRGTILTSTKNEVFIKKLKNNEIISLQYDANSQLNLITGEAIPFDNSYLSLGYSVNYIAEGTKLISLSIDFGGPKGEYILIGGLDFYNDTTKTCGVNGNSFKVDSNTRYIFYNKNMKLGQVKNKLLKVFYFKDSLNDSNVASTIEVVSGSNLEFKRTSLIRNFVNNEIIIGDPVDPLFQEKLILYSNSKIYDNRFFLSDKSLLKAGSLIDVYSFYDTISSTNLIYEVQVKSIPENDEFYYTGCPLTKNSVGLLSEFGLFTILPNANLSNFAGNKISFNNLLLDKNRIFSGIINKSGTFFNLSAAKEIPSFQTETSFDGNINFDDNEVENNSFKASINPNSTSFDDIFSLEINKSKTQLFNLLFEDINIGSVRVTNRNGSIMNIKSNTLNEVLSVGKTVLNSTSLVGVTTKKDDYDITINNINMDYDSPRHKIYKVDGSDGQNSDVSDGNFLVCKIKSNFGPFIIDTVYIFNSAEIIGKISQISNESISVGGLNIPISDFTLFRGLGNQVIESDKILPNSVVKVVTMHGLSRAISRLTGKTLPSNSATIARIVYVLQGPDPVSTNEPVATPTIFPNPSTTTVSIAVPENVISDVTVTTILGEKVFTKSNVTGTTQFSTASLPIGQYIVKISNNKGSTNQILQVIR